MQNNKSVRGNEILFDEWPACFDKGRVLDENKKPEAHLLPVLLFNLNSEEELMFGQSDDGNLWKL
ncbi:MAG: hypothetical protein LBE92_01330 [Chryseobacterium sp.]|jgi:hypothetical protein|uniref:hypothetical protein n=1 Tax=Chryseobacterium sp. TaxID=1871047 RepID=UPI002831AF4A|nr:hypothetical protein [Chryseobacterium sp.]MDR2234741.1 hypothetical protein [Chryseobacterium sp.]